MDADYNLPRPYTHILQPSCSNIVSHIQYRNNKKKATGQNVQWPFQKTLDRGLKPACPCMIEAGAAMTGEACLAPTIGQPQGLAYFNSSIFWIAVFGPATILAI